MSWSSATSGGRTASALEDGICRAFVSMEVSRMIAPRCLSAGFPELSQNPLAIELTLAVPRAVEASALPVFRGDFKRSQHGADSGKAHRGLRDSDAQGLFERLAYAR